LGSKVPSILDSRGFDRQKTAGASEKNPFTQTTPKQTKSTFTISKVPGLDLSRASGAQANEDYTARRKENFREQLDANCKQNYEFLRFVKFCLTAASRIDNAREMLQKHQYFLIDDLFSEFDKGNRGFLTAEDLLQGILKYTNRRPDVQRFMNIAGSDTKGLTRFQLRDAVMPTCLGSQSARPFCKSYSIRDE